jgi:hypothetical protein
VINGHTVKPVGNAGELCLAYQCIADKLPPFVQNYNFLPDRKFEIDLAWVEYKCGVEVNGGVFTKGAHGSPLAILRDMEKSNLLVLCGWKILRYTPSEVSVGNALAGIKKLLARSM